MPVYSFPSVPVDVLAPIVRDVPMEESPPMIAAVDSNILAARALLEQSGDSIEEIY